MAQTRVIEEGRGALSSREEETKTDECFACGRECYTARLRPARYTTWREKIAPTERQVIQQDTGNWGQSSQLCEEQRSLGREWWKKAGERLAARGRRLSSSSQGLHATNKANQPTLKQQTLGMSPINLKPYLTFSILTNARIPVYEYRDQTTKSPRKARKYTIAAHNPVVPTNSTDHTNPVLILNPVQRTSASLLDIRQLLDYHRQRFRSPSFLHGECGTFCKVERVIARGRFDTPRGCYGYRNSSAALALLFIDFT